MCGFAGVVSTGRAPAPRLLEGMLETIRHRGPDDGGVWCEGPAALGSRRLSIIDLAGGHQPLSDESGRYWIAYNGEVYNFKDLRARMEKDGARFRTGTDTEVVVQWFARRGEAGLVDFNGMFAFAIWDRRDRRLWVVRDRCGKKPAYYAPLEDGIVCGSELHTVAAHPRVGRGIDRASLAKFFAYDFVPSPATPLAGVKKLEPATFLRWEAGRVSTHRYWTPPTPGSCGAAVDSAESRIRETLRRGVKSRLVSDVPLGVLLSGGVDSSAVSALARTEGVPLRSFSISFDDPSYDESAWARKVAEHLGTSHTVEPVTMADAAAAVPEVLSRMDDLLADSSLIPTYLLSKAARKHVTVVLSGDGGDELFAGYPTFFAHRVAEPLGKLPVAFWRGAERLANALPVSHGYMSLDFIAGRFFRGLGVPGRWRNQAWLGSFSPWEIGRVLPGAPAPEEIYADVEGFAPPGDAVDRALAETFRFYLGEGVLTKVDRASMLVSLEVRSPFLDDEMLDLAASIPWTLKMKGRKGKVVLKRALAGLLPPSVLARKKQGFAMPVARWLGGALRPLAEDLLSRSEGLDRAFVQDLWTQHLRRRRNRARELWSLLVFQVWQARLKSWPLAPE